MNISLTSAGLAGLLLAATAADASAWTRHTTVNTWRGTYTVNAAGGCSGGVCSRTRTVTGPYGGTVTRSGTVVRTGPNQYSYQQANAELVPLAPRSAMAGSAFPALLPCSPGASP